MATDTDYRKYTWRNLGQKELKEMWFAARGSYSTSNQTVNLSALGNYFGTGNFFGTTMTHNGPEYLVSLHFAGSTTNPLPLTYKIDTDDTRKEADTATAINTANVVEISMATGLKIDAYRIDGLSFLKNCWRNQEIADLIKQPFVENAETVHEATVDLDLPTNMTYVKLPRYGFTNEAIEKVGVDGLFDSAKEKRTEDETIGLSYTKIDGTKGYKPGFKWGPSLTIGGQSYDTSRLKDWGFAERVPIVLADTYTKECRFHLPEIKTLADKDVLQVKCNNGTVKTFNFVEGDKLACYIQKAEITHTGIQPLAKFPSRDALDDGAPIYTWYEKKQNQSIAHTITDLLVQPRITVLLSDAKARGTLLARGTIYQRPDIDAVDGLTWDELDKSFLAPMTKTFNYTVNPSYADIEGDISTDKTESVILPQGGSVNFTVDVPARMTFGENNKISGAVALGESQRYTINSTLVQSIDADVGKFKTIGESFLNYLKGITTIQPYFDWTNHNVCGSSSLAGFVLVSSLPAKVDFYNVCGAWNATEDGFFSDIYTSRLYTEGPQINNFEVITRDPSTPNFTDKVQTAQTRAKNCPLLCLTGAQSYPTAYVWNWNFEITNFPIELPRQSITLSSLATITNQSFFDLTTSSTHPIAESTFNSMSEVAKGSELLVENGYPYQTYLRLSDENWGSSISIHADATQCPDHVVFILWSKSPDAYEYLKKQLLKSP